MSNDQNRWHMDEEKLAAELAVAGPTKPSSLPSALLPPALEDADQIEIWMAKSRWWRGYTVFVAVDDARPVKMAWFPSEEPAKAYVTRIAQTIVRRRGGDMQLFSES